MNLKDFLKKVLELGKDDIFKVDVKDSFSFFNTEEIHKEKVLSFFTDFKQNGRFVNVEISQDINRNRGNGRRRKSRRGDRRSSGINKTKNQKNFKSSSRRSNSNDSRNKESRSRRSKSFNSDSYSRPRKNRRK